MSVTKQALMMSLRTRVWSSPVSTRTAARSTPVIGRPCRPDERDGDHGGHAAARAHADGEVAGPDAGLRVPRLAGGEVAGGRARVAGAHARREVGAGAAARKPPQPGREVAGDEVEGSVAGEWKARVDAGTGQRKGLHSGHLQNVGGLGIEAISGRSRGSERASSLAVRINAKSPGRRNAGPTTPAHRPRRDGAGGHGSR